MVASSLYYHDVIMIDGVVCLVLFVKGSHFYRSKFLISDLMN